MDLVSRMLVISLLVVWTAILIDYKTLGNIFSRGSSSDSQKSSSNRGNSGGSSSDSSGSFRFRETYHKVVDKKPDSGSSSSDSFRFRESLHKVVDKKPDPSSSSSNSDSFRIRKTYHNIVDKKTEKPKNNYYPTNNPTPPPYGWNFGSNNPSLSGSEEKPKGGFHNLKFLASLIKKNPNYGSSSHHKRPGYYYDYNLRPDRYGHIDGEICTNNQNFDGIIYGQMKCPLVGYDYDETACCGTIGYQYCCRPSYSKKSEIGIITGIVFVFLICSCACLCTFGFCFVKYKMNKKNSINEENNNQEKAKLNENTNETNNELKDKNDDSPPPFDEKPSEIK